MPFFMSGFFAKIYVFHTFESHFYPKSCCAALFYAVTTKFGQENHPICDRKDEGLWILSQNGAYVATKANENAGNVMTLEVLMLSLQQKQTSSLTFKNRKI